VRGYRVFHAGLTLAMRAITDAKDFGGFVRQLHMFEQTRSTS
jgi:hypothetical protein